MSLCPKNAGYLLGRSIFANENRSVRALNPLLVRCMYGILHIGTVEIRCRGEGPGESYRVVQQRTVVRDVIYID
jgi:hypothetical protein